MSEESDVTPEEAPGKAAPGRPIAPPTPKQRESDKASRPGFRGDSNARSKAQTRKKNKKAKKTEKARKKRQ